MVATLVICLFAVAAMGAGVGYLMGAQSNHDFTVSQEDFLYGLVAGTKIRTDHTFVTDAQRRSACAGQFYPLKPLAMAGCVEALHDPPSDGYHIPG